MSNLITGLKRANIAFLLEILVQYGEASHFWERAFEDYLDESDGTSGFHIVYHYRQGMLLHRHGDQEKALNHMNHALKIAMERKERFMEERVRLGYGYIIYRLGQWGVATEMFEKGLQLAWDLRNLNAMVEQVMSRLWCAVRAENEQEIRHYATVGSLLPGKKELGEKLSILAKMENLKYAAQYLENEGLSLPISSPKLPAYLPSIDLEMIPSWDINRYLVSGKPEPNLARKSG